MTRLSWAGSLSNWATKTHSFTLTQGAAHIIELIIDDFYHLGHFLPYSIMLNSFRRQVLITRYTFILMMFIQGHVYHRRPWTWRDHMCTSWIFIIATCMNYCWNVDFLVQRKKRWVGEHGFISGEKWDLILSTLINVIPVPPLYNVLHIMLSNLLAISLNLIYLTFYIVYLVSI